MDTAEKSRTKKSAHGTRRAIVSKMDLKKKKFRKNWVELRSVTHSSKAFAEAWQQARASGQRIVFSDNRFIYEVAPNGRRRRLKAVEPPTPAKIGERIIIR